MKNSILSLLIILVSTNSKIFSQDFTPEIIKSIVSTDSSILPHCNISPLDYELKNDLVLSFTEIEYTAENKFINPYTFKYEFSNGKLVTYKDSTYTVDSSIKLEREYLYNKDQLNEVTELKTKTYEGQEYEYNSKYIYTYNDKSLDKIKKHGYKGKRDLTIFTLSYQGNRHIIKFVTESVIKKYSFSIKDNKVLNTEIKERNRYYKENNKNQEFTRTYNESGKITSLNGSLYIKNSKGEKEIKGYYNNKTTYNKTAFLKSNFFNGTDIFYYHYIYDTYGNWILKFTSFYEKPLNKLTPVKIKTRRIKYKDQETGFFDNKEIVYINEAVTIYNKQDNIKEIDALFESYNE